MEDKEYLELKTKLDAEEKRRAEISRIKAEISNLKEKKKLIFKKNDPFTWASELRFVAKMCYDRGDGRGGTVEEESIYLTDYKLAEELLDEYIKKRTERLNKLLGVK